MSNTSSGLCINTQPHSKVIAIECSAYTATITCPGACGGAIQQIVTSIYYTW